MSEADYTVPDLIYVKLPSYSAAEMIGRQLREQDAEDLNVARSA